MDFFNRLVKLFFPVKDASGAPAGTPPPVSQNRFEVPPNRSVLLSWKAPTRPFKQRSPEFFRRLMAILVIIGILLILAGQFLFLAVFVSLAVLGYILSNVPPEETTHEIDNYGVNYLGKQYYWSELKFFFFTVSSGSRVLNIDTVEPFPGRLFLVCDAVPEDKVKDLMSQFLPFREEAPKAFADDLFNKIASKINLEGESTTSTKS